MKCLAFFKVCVLLLWTWTGFVSCAAGAEIKVTEVYDGIQLECPQGYSFSVETNNTKNLPYKDENTGEYTCTKSGDGGGSLSIYVKFRTCDNCIELDTTSIAGMAIGNLVATCVVGVAVYLSASVIRSGNNTYSYKRSDSETPAPRKRREVSNDPYQSLHFRSPKDEYDKLNTKR